MSRRAAIDLGSNSVLLTVVDDSGVVLHDEARIVRLGKNLGDGGAFLPDRMTAARQAMGDYVRTAEALGVPAADIRAVTTSAARRASNAAAFFATVHADLGLTVRTISGEEEARLSYLGAQVDLPLQPGPLCVIDVGGGSSEVVVGIGATPTGRRSLESGSVRLTEDFGLDALGTAGAQPGQVERARAHVAGLVATLAWPLVPTHAVAVAGTATTLAAMDLGLPRFDSAAVHGHRLSREALAAWGTRLQVASPAERRRLAQVSPERADALLAGTLLIDAVLDAAGLGACTVSTRGLRFGVLAGT